MDTNTEQNDGFNLEGFKKDPVFLVPDNYFRDLPNQIQSRVSHHKKYTFRPLIIRWSVALVSLSLLIFSVYLATNTTKTAPANLLTLNDVSNAEIVNYLRNNCDLEELNLANNDITPAAINSTGYELDVEEAVLEDLNYSEIQELLE